MDRHTRNRADRFHYPVAPAVTVPPPQLRLNSKMKDVPPSSAIKLRRPLPSVSTTPTLTSTGSNSETIFSLSAAAADRRRQHVTDELLRKKFDDLESRFQLLTVRFREQAAIHACDKARADRYEKECERLLQFQKSSHDCVDVAVQTVAQIFPVRRPSPLVERPPTVSISSPRITRIPEMSTRTPSVAAVSPARVTTSTGASPARVTAFIGASPARVTAFIGASPARLTAFIGASPARLTASIGASPTRMTTSTGASPARVTTSIGASPTRVTTSTGASPARVTASIGASPASASPGVRNRASRGLSKPNNRPSSIGGSPPSPLIVSLRYLIDAVSTEGGNESIKSIFFDCFDKLDVTKVGWLSRDMSLALISIILEQRDVRWKGTVPKVICSRMLRSIGVMAASPSKTGGSQSVVILRRIDLLEFIKLVFEFIIDQERGNN